MEPMRLANASEETLDVVVMPCTPEVIAYVRNVRKAPQTITHIAVAIEVAVECSAVV